VQLLRQDTGRGPTKARTVIDHDSEATGRKVIAFMSDNHIDPDYGAEVFVLEPGGDADPRDGYESSSSRRASPGCALEGSGRGS
jgi:hypothetical protein